MKNPVFKNSLKFLFIFLLTGSFVTALGQVAEKKIKKDYNVSQGFTLGIDNEYGEINLINWDQDKVSVEITVSVEAKSDSKAKELLEKIDIEISESKSEVNFDTDAENVNSTGKTKVNVVYDVKAPVWINADLEQSYGNVYIQELTGIAELEIRYGNLTATALMNETEDWNTLDLKYGAASIDHLTALTAEVKYSELTVKESGIMETESAYSKLFLGSVSELSSECKYDKLNIDMVESALHVDGAYTNVTVGELSKDFAEVVVDLAYGNFKAGLESGAAFKIEADVSYGSARIPDGDYLMEKQATNVEVDGNIGGKSDALLVADIKYGNLVLE